MKNVNMLQKFFACFLIATVLICVLLICIFGSYAKNEKTETAFPGESETQEDTKSSTSTTETEPPTIQAETEPAIPTETDPPIIPVITGVKDEITIFENTPDETVSSVLLDGVCTVEGEVCEVKFKILNEDGTKPETLSAGRYNVIYYCDRKDVVEVKSTLTVKPIDTTPPVISGAKDKTVYIGSTVSYRSGVTVTDDYDKNVQLKIDASKVDLTRVGKYTLVYSAVDKNGNATSVSVSVNVINPPNEQQNPPDPTCTKEELDALCNTILKQIINDNMSDYEKASAIYNRVRQIRYVGSSNKDSWISGAYLGLTTGRGDCFNYYAASKALLTLAGIPNYDLQRKGGDQPHYWNLVCVNGGWYHFDACPTPNVYPIRCFLYTEDEVVAYSKAIASACPDYYVYDYEKCPYEVVQSRNS